MTRPAPIAIDTLKALEDLQAAGLEESTARAVVDLIAQTQANRAVTLVDLREMEHRLETRLREFDGKLDTQEARNRVTISAIRKEGADIRGEIAGRITRFTLVLLLVLVAMAAIVLWTPVSGGLAWVFTGTGS